MPFGICSASEVLQKRAYKSFEEIDGVHVIADDMIIAAETEEKHDQILRKVLIRARQNNIKFNPSKIQLKKSEVIYMGNILTKHGIKPDSEKVKAVSDMSDPSSKGDVRRLIGILNYLSPYIPNMSDTTSPIRSLMKNDVQFKWLPKHSCALDKIKKVLTSEPVLQFYNPNKGITIQCDASKAGLGACHLQEGGPVAYASRSLTEVEQRWFQIEKELLSIVFAAERFHLYIYIYGREVEVENDQKPLETILRKPIQRASPRIQLMMLNLLRYKLYVKYVPGKKVLIADALSRAYTDSADTQDYPEIPEMRDTYS